MNKLRAGGQGIIEYVVILAIVAIISILFVPKIPHLFSGYVIDAREAMKPPIVIVDGQVVQP